jgi:twitching motility protein PilT
MDAILSRLMASVYASEDYFKQLLVKAVQAGASDIHFKVGMPPAARVSGDLVFFRTEALTEEDTAAIAFLVVPKGSDLSAKSEHDAAYTSAGTGRFRVNVFRQRGTFGIVLRVIPLKVPTFEDLGLPPACKYLAERERGLVLVVGAAGNGKSTTLASMVGHINATKAVHIVTIEDPIEFMHSDNRASVSQREVGVDTASFSDALRASLRQDPDVILVGEIRDETTMDIALKASETGHLVFSTLHTPDVSRTVGRILALSPKGQAGSSEEMRARLGDALQGIVAQRLLPKKGGGVVLATEILVVTGTARATIKRPEGNPPLKDIMEKGVHPYGMHTFAMEAERLAQRGLLDEATMAAEGF